MEKLKKKYAMPKLTVHGDVATITQATKVGTKLDKALPAGANIHAVMNHLTS